MIYNLPIAVESGNTTILFPSAISGLYGKSIAVQEQENASFLILFTPGNFYFTIRAITKDAEDPLTVIFHRKACVLHLTASENPVYGGSQGSDHIEFGHGPLQQGKRSGEHPPKRDPRRTG